MRERDDTGFTKGCTRRRMQEGGEGVGVPPWAASENKLDLIRKVVVN